MTDLLLFSPTLQKFFAKNTKTDTITVYTFKKGCSNSSSGHVEYFLKTEPGAFWQSIATLLLKIRKELAIIFFQKNCLKNLLWTREMQFCQICRGFLSSCEVPGKLLVNFWGFFKNSKKFRKKISCKYSLWTIEKKGLTTQPTFVAKVLKISFLKFGNKYRRKTFELTKSVSRKFSSVHVKYSFH